VKLSVIIPCLNAADTIGCQLEALSNQCWSQPWEVVVSDNGSTDNSIAVAEQFRGQLPGLRVVDASGRRGASHARNRGAAMASGEALAFIDADDEVAPGWLEAIGNALSTHDFVASRMGFEKLNIPSTAKHMQNHPQVKGVQKLWYPPYLSHAGGCGLAVKRSLHEAVGGYDESFLRVMDAEYCIRIQRLGVQLQFVQDALIHVRCRITGAASFRQVCLWGEYNALIYKRHRPAGCSEMWRWKSHLRSWVEIVRNVSKLQSSQGRLQLFQQVGWQVGILKGSIKHRVPPVPLP
jgi:glycosyltransferase involved in cell wall biosynthesis